MQVLVQRGRRSEGTNPRKDCHANPPEPSQAMTHLAPLPPIIALNAASNSLCSLVVEAAGLAFLPAAPFCALPPDDVCSVGGFFWNGIRTLASF